MLVKSPISAIMADTEGGKTTGWRFHLGMGALSRHTTDSNRGVNMRDSTHLTSPSSPVQRGHASCLGLRTGVSPHFSMKSIREMVAMSSRGGPAPSQTPSAAASDAYGPGGRSRGSALAPHLKANFATGATRAGSRHSRRSGHWTGCPLPLTRSNAPKQTYLHMAPATQPPRYIIQLPSHPFPSIYHKITALQLVKKLTANYYHRL